MQKTFADRECLAKRKTTRRERFLSELDRLTPWRDSLAVLAPFYPKGQGGGRPPIGLEKMLRMYIVQQSRGLSEEGIENALYDSQAVRQFVGLDLGRELAPDATTLLKFRHPLEAHKPTETIFATIFAAPSSTKNQKSERDPEMHRARRATISGTSV